MSMNTPLQAKLAFVVWICVVGGAAWPQAPERLQGSGCVAGIMVAPGGGSGGRFSACLPVLDDVLSKLNELAKRDQDTRRELERFFRETNATSQLLKPQLVDRLAQALSSKLSATQRRGDEALLAEIDRLRVEMRQTNLQVTELRSKPTTAEGAKAVLAGDAGEAIARLDFDAVRQSLQGIETMIQAEVAGAYRDPAMLKLVREEALAGLDIARMADAERRCPKGWRALLSFQSVGMAAEQQGRFNAAGLTYKDMAERAARVVDEINVVDAIADAQAESARATAQASARQAQQSYDSAASLFANRRAAALKFVRTASEHTQLATADALKQRAAALLGDGKPFDAADLLIDGANLLGRLESDAGNYRYPLPEIRKPRRPPADSEVTSQSVASKEAGRPQPGGVCR